MKALTYIDVSFRLGVIVHLRVLLAVVSFNFLTIPVKVLDEGIEVPRHAHIDDAGADLCTTEDIELAPFERRLVGTGVALAIPEGYAGFVHPRSGLAVKSGLSIVNSPGTIDAGYRGEIKVPLINLDPTETITLKRGDRIAQIVIQAVYTGSFHEVQQLSSSGRGVAGFGSTG